MAKILTAASVAKVRGSPQGCREIPDGGCVGLYLVVYPSGRKSWALRYRRPASGVSAKLILGSVYDAGKKLEVDAKPVIGGHHSLGSARHLVAELKHEIARGRDPGRAHIIQKQKVLASDKFGGAAADFIEQYAKHKTRRWRSTARLLGLKPHADGQRLEAIRRGLADRWRDRPIDEIDGDLIHAVVHETRETGIPGLEQRRMEPSEARARSFYATLSSMFSWLVRTRRLKANPCVGVSRPETSKARERILTDEEIVKFWRAADRADPPFGPLLKLLLLTGARLNEIAGARRSELSADGKVLAIPGERSKNHRSHTIFLPPLARDILQNVVTESEIIFTRTSRTPVSGWSRLKQRLDEAMAIPAWRLHDLRRTCATGMAEIGIAPHIVEACLNHISGARAGVAGVYNRAAYASEKAAALARWSDHIQALIE
jgi:integrase